MVYLPVTPGGANVFLQLVIARYEKGAMILTSNRGFAEWRPCAPPKKPKYPPLVPQPGATGGHRLEAWTQSCPSLGAAFLSRSLSRAQRQTALPLRGNSALRQSPPEAENANPSKAGDPSMPASFTSTDSESEITPGGNPPSIQSGRKPL